MDAATTLKNHDLRVTKIRLAILEALGDGHQAKPYGELQAALGEFDRTTLYRTLLALIDKGLIHKALEENGESYYALCGGCTTHAHTTTTFTLNATIAVLWSAYTSAVRSDSHCLEWL